MLSHQYRMRLQSIAERIENGETVELNDMIWCEKLCKSNKSAAQLFALLS